MRSFDHGSSDPLVDSSKVLKRVSKMAAQSAQGLPLPEICGNHGETRRIHEAHSRDSPDTPIRCLSKIRLQGSCGTPLLELRCASNLPSPKRRPAALVGDVRKSAMGHKICIVVTETQTVSNTTERKQCWVTQLVSPLLHCKT